MNKEPATVKYTEPADYFPKEIRKETGIGEYAKEDRANKTDKEEELNAEQ